jgi:hypothetical protein
MNISRREFLAGTAGTFALQAVGQAARTRSYQADQGILRRFQLVSRRFRATGPLG